MDATSQQVTEIMARPTCSVEEAAKVLHIGRTQAYRAVRSGELRSIRIGKRVLVPTNAIRQLLEGSSDPAQRLPGCWHTASA
jgi:excisionase family DNA binding protein